MTTHHSADFVVCRKCGLLKSSHDFSAYDPDRRYHNKECKPCRAAEKREKNRLARLARPQSSTIVCTDGLPGPDQPLMIGGSDWSWAFVYYKAIRGYPDYLAGTNGSVWSCRISRSNPDREWRLLNPTRGGNGYLTFKIRRDGDPRKTAYVHAAILTTFIGPCPDGMECLHLNGDKTDNRLCNLRWGTRRENHEDAVRHGTYRRGSLKKGKRGTKLTEADIPVIRRFRREGLLQREIANSFGVAPGVIINVLNGRYWKHVPDNPE